MWLIILRDEQKNAEDYEPLTGYSEGLADLVHQMLREDPAKRPTVDQILASAFVQEALAELREKIRNGG